MCGCYGQTIQPRSMNFDPKMSNTVLIGCSKKKCRRIPLSMLAKEHIEMETRYHLIEVNLFDILV